MVTAFGSLLRRPVVVLLAFTVACFTLVAGFGTPAGAQQETTAGGTVRERSGNEDVLIEGVEILVESADGSFSVIGVTGSDGTWSVVLPGGGDYVATLDVGTLPDGVELRDIDKISLSFRLNEGRNRNLLFPLGDPVQSSSTGDDGTTNDGATGADDVAPGDNKIIQLLVDGIKLGLIIGMCAIGLSLVFGTTGLVNFSHGEFVSLGAVTAFLFNGWLDWKISLFLAGAIAAVVAAAAGGVYDALVWSRLRKGAPA